MSESELVNDSYQPLPPISPNLTVSEGTNQRGRQMPRRHNGLTSGPVPTTNLQVLRKKGKRVTAVNGVPVKGCIPTADGDVVDFESDIVADTDIDLELLADGDIEIEDLEAMDDDSSNAALDYLGRNVF